MPQWHEHSDESLIELAASHTQQQVPASIEMQRRLMVAIKEFNVQSTRQSSTMIRLTWAIVGLTVALGILAGLQLGAIIGPPQHESPVAAEWRGFYYADVEAMRGVPIGRDKLAGARSFRTLQDCVQWGRAAVAGSSAAGFECSAGCRFDSALGEVICSDTTRVIR